MSARSPLSLGRRELLAMAGGTLLYAGISWLTNIFPLAAAQGIDIRPGVAVPIFFGLVFGPLVGLVTGTLGNLLSDLWSGWAVYPPDPYTGHVFVDLVQGLLLNWQVGNGLMGLVAGLATASPALFVLQHGAGLRRRRFATLADHLRALAFTALGIVAGMGFAAFTDMPLDHLSFGSVWAESFIPVVRVNLLNAVILVPILLFNYEHLDLGSAAWLRSGLMRRLLLAILVSAALPVALLGLFLTQQATGVAGSPAELTFKLAFTVALTLVFTIANAALLAQSISRSLLRLTQAAQAMQQEQLTSVQAGDLEVAAGSDEIGRLSQVFGRMAKEVILREERLRQQVEQLRIEIDQSKKVRQVAEITDTDYFRTLRDKAQQLRDKRGGEA